MEELVYRPFEDRNTRALALAGQKVDVAYGLPSGQFESVKNAKNTKVATRTEASIARLGLNLYNKPISDLKFRKAINYAISQEKIVKGPQNGLAVPAKGMTSPVIWLSAYDSLPTYGPDKDKAKQLVEESSYNGETLQYIGREDEPRDAKLVASTIQQELKDIGVNLEIQIIGQSLFKDRRKQGDYDMFAGTNTVFGTRMITEFFKTWASDDLPRGGDNAKYHSNIGHNQPEVQERYDSLYTKALEAPSDEKQKDLAIKLEHVLMEDALPVVPLFHSKGYVGMRPSVEGVNWHPEFDKSRIENLKYFK